MKSIALASIFPESTIFRGLKLGILAFVVNFMLHVASDGEAVPIGNLALFIAASGLPLAGLVSALGAALIPLSLAAPDSAIEQLRVGVVCLSIGYCAKRLPYVPSYLIVLALWSVLFWPFSLATLAPEVVEPLVLFNTGFTEIVLALIAGILLLSPSIWRKLNDQNRPVRPAPLLMHICAILVAVSMLGVARLCDIGPPMLLTATSMFGLAVFGVFILLISTFIGWKLGNLFEKEPEPSCSGMLGLQHAFSGLASEYWRRQQEQETRSDAEAISSRLEGLSTCPIESGPVEESLLSGDPGICLVMKDGTIASVNRKFRQYTGITLSIVNGKHLELVGMDPVISRHMLTLLNRTLSSGGEVSELKLNQLPARLRFFEIRSQRCDLIKQSTLKGDKDCVAITIRDITDRRTIESSLLQAQKLESLGSMVKGLAISFNNSLACVSGEASLALESDSAERHRHALENVAGEVLKTSRMTHQLIEFASDSSVTLETCNLQSIISDRLDLLRKSVGEGTEVIFEGGDEQIYATIGVGLFTQALTNLLLNAREAYPEGKGTIRVSLGSEWIEEEVARLHSGTVAGHYARVRVQDSGVGMTSEVLEKAFNPLFSTKTGSGHAGLGLSTVFAIVRSHDGFLSVESQPGKGTSVSIYLPFQTEPYRTETVPREDANEADDLFSGHGEKLLLVEDDSSFASIVEKLCEHLAYKCTIVARDEDIGPDFDLHAFNLAIVDLDSAKYEPHPALARIRDSQVKTAAIGSGATGDKCDLLFLRKPFDIRSFAKFIRSAMS